MRPPSADARRCSSTIERTVAIFEKALGLEHPDTATSLNALADLLRTQRDFVGARPLYQRALAIREKTLGPDHPELAGILNNLAFNFQAEGDLTAARPLYVRALAICERGLDPEHLTASRVRRNMATLLLATGQPGEALGLGAAALAAQQKALGLDHAWTKDSARVTADALLGRTEEAKALRERYGLTPPRSPSPHEPLMMIAVIALADRVGRVRTCRSLLECHLLAAEFFHRPRPGSGPCFPRLCFERDADLANHRTPID